MDFVEGMPVSENKDMILVVVDRFTKYALFIALKHPITVKTVATTFKENIFKLHGLPSVTVTDRDRIFTSNLWQDLFKSLGVKLTSVQLTIPKEIARLKESSSVWKTISETCHSCNLRSGIIGWQWQNGGTIPLFIPP